MGSPLSHIFRVGRRSVGASPDGDGGAFPDQRVKSGCIPVRKADVAKASGAADGIGRGAAVDADAGTVQSGPEDAGGVVGAGGRCGSHRCAPREDDGTRDSGGGEEKTAEMPSISLPFDKLTKRIPEGAIASGNTTRLMLDGHKKTMSP